MNDEEARPRKPTIQSENRTVPDSGPVIRATRDLLDDEGALINETIEPFCCVCGTSIQGQIRFCAACGRKVCENHCQLIIDENLCNRCVLKRTRLDPKLRFKVAWVRSHVQRGIVRKEDVAELVGGTKDEVAIAWEQLKRLGYVKKRNLSFFATFELTSKARDAIIACLKVYENEPDVILLKSQLEEKEQQWLTKKLSSTGRT